MDSKGLGEAGAEGQVGESLTRPSMAAPYSVLLYVDSCMHACISMPSILTWIAFTV